MKIQVMSNVMMSIGWIVVVGFVVLPNNALLMPRVAFHHRAAVSATRLYESKKPTRKQPPKKMTIAELRKELLKDPQQLQGAPKKPKYKRTRKRVEQPQQSYLYAAQRKQLQQEDQEDTTEESDPAESKSSASSIDREGPSPLDVAKELGLVNAAMQHCDALVDTVEPMIVGKLRVGESGSEEYAYVIHKPAGWAIIGSGKPNSSTKPSTETPSKVIATTSSSTKQRIKIKSKSGKEEYLEFDEADILALLTPEERAGWEAQGGLDITGLAYDDEENTPTVDIPGWYDVAQMTPEEREEAGIEDEDFDPDNIPAFNEADMLALMTPEEIEDYQRDKASYKLQHQQSLNQQQKTKSKNKKNKNPLQRYLDLPREEMDPTMLENLKRIERRLQEQKSTKASFNGSATRPSLATWLKDVKAREGTPIRGGKFWTAVAGATDVDDSGLVFLCPKSQVSNIFVDSAQYVTVVGTGEYLSPLPSKRKEDTVDIPKELLQMEIIAKVRKWREGDTCQTVRVSIAEKTSTCSSIIPHIQAQFADGIRGDPAAHPFDRRAARRLIHCQSLTVSSLAYDEDVKAELDELPDDIAIMAERLNNHKFVKGSFLGRAALRDNSLTNTYREINGASDGFPGWTVDRYADWLFVQHDPKEYRGPLPSIHDGYTKGVYYLEAAPDRGLMGVDSTVRPKLLEGRPAPDNVTVVENGVTYFVALDKDLSTGIFLDQRPQRAWLTRNCHEKTHVLNCFAHCGAFSIAAASAGASTVSLDLNKKWLDRVQPQLEANGIAFDERHDCIYGDCFEWLEKLAKRGEKFDLVILDPPSSSVGKKKKRWSIKNDMDELVALAAPLVKSGGLLWTTTNSARLSPIKFARMCKRGLDLAGLENAKLERIQPMPIDFPSIGPQPVKNFVWRIP